jgi:PAS domain S-box-containing protein
MRGENEISDVVAVDGNPYLRLMRPLVVTKRCLDCHSKEGYAEGEIRGGISVAVPLKSLREIEARDQTTSLLWHSIICLVGLGGIIAGTRSIQKKRRAHELAREAQVSTERKLASQEQYLKAIVEGSPIAVVVLDVHQIIESCNESFEHIFGYSKAEAIGKNLDDLIVPADRRTEAEQLARSPYGNERFHKELLRCRKDGSLVAVEAFAKSISTNGFEVGVVAQYVDISERKQAEKILQRERMILRTLIDNIPDGIYAKDTLYRKTLANRADLRTVGVQSEAEVIGKDDFSFFPKTVAEGFLVDDKSVILSGAPVLNREEYAVNVAGEKRWLLTSKLPLKDERGNIIGLLGIGRDITERKRAEEQVRLQMSIIEKQNRELTTANEKALEATKAKSAFLASMSHELRTPLNAIIGYSEMLDEEMGDNGDDRYRADIEKVRAAGKHLLGLINDILDLSKIEAGRMELYLEEFDLKPVIGEVASTVQPLIAQNENIFVLTENEEIRLVRLDLTKVRQILFNLISNASKFTQNGTVSLEVTSVPGDAASGPGIRFRVSDTGIGITKEQEERLFKEFAQADGSTTRKFGGTGLGLAISKRFCEMMGGSIGIESSSSKGTTFVAILPQRIEESREGPILRTVPSIIADRVIPKKSCILIIDDDPSVRDLLTRYLTKEGYLTEAVSSGDEGLKRARETIPLAIILDVVMPSKDGWVVLQEIKGDPALEAVPVVMYTMVDDKNFGLAIGASEYLIKPVDKEKILHAIQRLVPQVKRSYVLVVDDDSDARITICRPMEKAGWNVRTADNGKSAIAILEKEIPGIIFLDIMMPVMDGFEFLALLQSRKEWDHIPVVIVTAKDLSTEESQRLNGAVMKVIQKGDLTPDKLLKQLTMLVPHMSQNTSH